MTQQPFPPSAPQPAFPPSAAPGGMEPFTNGNGNGQGGPGDGGGFGPGLGAGGLSVQGTVQSVDANTLVLKLANGQTVTIKLASSTADEQQAAGSQSDVAVGKTVIVGINGRFDMDGAEGGSQATTVTVVP